MTTPAGPLVWDVTSPDDARLFLAPERLSAAQLERIPTPSRVARRIDGRAAELAAAHSALWLVAGRDGMAIAAGPESALAALAVSLPAPAGPDLARALSAYAARAATLRFADGEVWRTTERTRVMGVLNVTPDSFSDGGRFANAPQAADEAARLIDEGADLVDIGGESTRPGAAPVAADEEARRVIPVIELVRRAHPRARLAVDTRRAQVAAQALDAGVDLVNDVSALADPEMAAVVARAGCPVVLMHMRGTPERMQADLAYTDLVGEICDGLAESLARATNAGVVGDRILVDPGLGFGKSFSANEELLRQLRVLHSLGRPLLVGASRKAFIGHRTGVTTPVARTSGSLAAAVAAALAGAAIVRVHDVRATHEALAVADAIAPRATSAVNAP